MTKHNIIASEKMAKDFIEWLPDLKQNETYYCCLFGRKKYDPTGTLKADKSQLKRFTCSKANMLNKIKQLECEQGSYTVKGVVVPDEALALYVTPNPRSFETAARESLIELARAVTKPYDGYNPHQIVLSKIQTSCGTKKYMDFDFDGVSMSEVAERIERGDIINREALTYIKTRGGFHLLVELAVIKPAYRRSWYQDIAGLPGVDVRGDNLIPFVGCYQGGFTPYFANP